jgi:predicted nucleic acid-binding protein
MPVVSNTSPISNLALIGKLHLLREQFGTILIPYAVRRELMAISNPEAKAAIATSMEAGWIEVRKVESASLVTALNARLHAGESEAIALAIETSASCILLDEKDARIAARRMKLTITGVLGVLLLARKRGGIGALKPLVDQLRQEARFYIAADLEHELLQAAGE